MAGLGQTERQVFLAGDDALDIGLLLRRAVVGERRYDREIADDRGFVLQIVVQAEALGGEMLADRRDRQIGGCLTAAGFGQAVAQMARAVGAALHLDDQCAPFRARTSVLLPIGARVLAPMVEELHVLALERLDLRLDEGVEFGEFGRYFRRQFEVHAASPRRLV